MKASSILLGAAAFATALTLSVSSVAQTQATPIRIISQPPSPGQPQTQAITVRGVQIAVPPEEAAKAAAEAAAAGGAPPATPATPEAAEAAAKAEADKKKQARLGKIKKLTFDRRPSTILKMWSNPNAAEEAEAAEDASKAGAAAAPSPVPSTTGTFVMEGAVIDLSDRLALAELMQGGDIPPVLPGGAPGADGAAAAAGAAAAPAEPDPIDDLLKELPKCVTLGDWPRVKDILLEMNEMDEEIGKAGYEKILSGLKTTPRDKPKPGQRPARPVNPRFAEKNSFSFDDVMGLIHSAPCELEKGALDNLGAIVKQAIDGGSVVEGLVTRFTAEVQQPVDVSVLKRREAAKILFAAGEPVEAGAFLPKLDTAVGASDHEAMNLLARFQLALHAKDPKPAHLEEAWAVLQALFASDEIEAKEKEEALKRAVELVPKIREELGQSWLEESFTSRPERGMEIVGAIGTATSTALQTHALDPSFRLKGLELQKTAVEALLESAPELATDWNEALYLLANNWLREAMTSYQYDQSTAYGPNLQRDAFGNFFYTNFRNQSRNNQIRAVASGPLLEQRPGDAWLALIPEGARPRFAMLFAQLFLKVNEEEQAFPFIEMLAKTHPEKAEDLVSEFLRVWTNNHDPNSNRGRTNYYMFMYGFDRKAESIPLTRSKQERNLKELAAWVERIQALPIEGPDMALLARAFTTCHSQAEVYRLDAIQEVFGSVDRLEPEAIAELVQRMRTNLVSVWRKPATQKDAKTKRKQKDIEAEVLRGYAVARGVLESARAEYPEDWSLQLAKASIDHDEITYRHDLAKSSEYSKKRQMAFAEFEKAADLYAATVGDLSEDEHSTRVYELWYYASLGACDLQMINPEKATDHRQAERIRQKIEDLPSEASERHMDMFANLLFTRMSSVNPAVKSRYLDGGFEIVGDNKRAREARKVYDYYADLVSEIKLEAEIDGTDVVGQEPFGVFVNIRHTKEIERESGGFGRYLQNQNNAQFSYNYGRPTEDYRDKFQEQATELLAEHFEVMSVTFESDKVHSRATEEYGWRVTPYAYMLLKARGPEVDTVPSVQLDLDFLDTSGYVVLPIETPPLPIDASSGADPRPITDGEITQILDERQADEGKLVLEVKAVGTGLIPDLEDTVDLDAEGFVIDKTDDMGLSVSRFDEEAEKTSVVSERTWMVTMRAEDDLEALPTKFAFGEPKIAEAATVHQRYVDADLIEVEREISLEERYGETQSKWAGMVIAAIFLGTVGAVVFIVLQRMPNAVTEEKLALPSKITPFTVLGFLREIEQTNGFDTAGKQELSASIGRLEEAYFKDEQSSSDDLRQIAEDWRRRSLQAQGATA